MATPAEIKKQIQAMISAGKSEEEIGKFISDATTPTEEKNKPTTITEPTTFMGGVGKSLSSGEALGAGLQGLGGYLRGATLDIPQSIIGGINTVMHPLDTISNIPSGLRNVLNTVERAGSDPEAFGRMMGQMTGQSLATAGLAKALPVPMQAIGSGLRKYQPVSGMVPGMFHMRTMRNVERVIGKGLEKGGEALGDIKFTERGTIPPTQSPFRTGTGAKIAIEPSPEIYNPETPTSTMRGFKQVQPSIRTPSSTSTGTNVPEPTSGSQRLMKPTTKFSATMEIQPKYNFKIVRGEDGYFYKVPKE